MFNIFITALLCLPLGYTIGMLLTKLKMKSTDLLEQENRNLKQQISEQSVNISTLKKDAEQLGENLNEQDKSLAVLEERLKSIEAERVRLQDELTIQSESFAKAETELKLKLSELTTKLQSEIKESASFKERNEGLEDKLADQNKSLAEIKILQEDKNQLTAKISQLSTSLTEQQKQHTEKVKLLDEAKDNLKHEFQNLAQKIFEEKSEKFTEVNKQKLDALITPFKEQIKDFAKKVDETYDKESKERVSLKEQIKQLQSLNQQMSEDAVNLTKALKGDSKTQGNWGELILERILEESGLQKGEEYLREQSFNLKDGGRYRPDVIVKLPDHKDVIIDSKVSLVAYERYCSSESDSKREAALAEHVLSVRSHIKDLSSKNYESIPEINTLEYVLLFMPVEGAFRAAIEADEKLLLDASKQNIMIVSPSTLLICLKTIYSLWTYEYQNLNARKIADRASSLYDKFYGFVKDLESVGAALEKSQASYEAAFSKLHKGRGNLVRQCEDLKKLGATPKKQVPPTLLDKAKHAEEMAQLEN
ncbi:MAG: DNA recombination protein RmuC [Lentisphaeria bacterium]|nr:DNA recombination protein RmuC [Lentisphaeria bacterium]